MRERGIVLAQFFLKREERFLGGAIAPNESERPIGDLLFTGVPFIGPGEKDRPGESTTHHAVDMPAEHFRLLLLGMSDRVHSEFAQHERLFFREILQAEEILFEIALVVQVDVETTEVDVLREEVFRRWITRV